MSQAYDLFAEDGSGNRIFVKTVIGLNQVKELLMKLATLKPGRYVIYDPTLNRLVEPFIKSHPGDANE
jgi:hypothetical protein